MLRRSVSIAVVTLLLVVGGGALAHAFWSLTEPLPATTLASDDFAVSAHWVTEPELAQLFPGEATDGTAAVSLDSAASWQYSVTASMQGSLADHLTVAWFADPSCEGPALTMGQTNGVTLDGGAEAEFCIRFTLASDTPGERQGESATVSVNVEAHQVRP
ncbi:MAG TPA: hypothetical protein VK024_10215 [Actinomycetaceae bacterium]|nr:hypothetical protein [Actinomycetaceae bacterium]